ncbi:MAG: hypothetical protein GVY13_07870 [Alphaproteobacteria bacterium]|jgi:hypothetical protein|nr:hypothetical protein [Alphaproteobacteria bacterium]
MTRPLWLVLSAAVCLLVFVVLMLAPGTGGGVTGPWSQGGQTAATLFALLVAAGLAFVLMLAVPAGVDALATRRARRRLAGFLQMQEEEGLDAAGLLEALAPTPWLAERTEAYFRIVGLGDPRTFPFNRTAFGAVPAGPYLGPASTVEQRLGIGVFRTFPLLFFALGVAGALSLVQGLPGAGAPLPLEALPAIIQATLFALAAKLVLDGLVALRNRQAAAFCTEVEALVHQLLPDPLGELTATLRANHRAIREILETALGRMENDLRQRVQELSAALVAPEPAPPREIGRAPEAEAEPRPPGERREGARDGPREGWREGGGPLMPAALAQIIGDVNARQTAQTERLTTTLAHLTDTMVELRERVTVALDSFLDGMQSHTQDTLQTLADGANTTLAHLAEIIETNRAQLQASADSAEQIRQTWHELVEVLVPTIERLVDLHAQLSRLVDGSSGSDLSRAGEELATLAQGQRQMLDLMMRVAERMGAVTAAMSSTPAPGTAAGSGSGATAAVRRPPPSHDRAPERPAERPAAGPQHGPETAGPRGGIGREIEDLRQELAAMAGDLPDLDRPPAERGKPGERDGSS